MTRIGLIGCGRWGRNAARAMAQAGVLAWVADADYDAARELAALHGVEDRAGIDLHDCDAVWICTPIETHELLVHEAISRGKHVLCEKPLARTKAQAQMLADEARRAGVVLMADHTWLGHHGALTVTNPSDIYEFAVERYAKDERGFDCLEDLLPHDVVLTTRAFGARVARVCVDVFGDLTRVYMTPRQDECSKRSCIGGDERAVAKYSYDRPEKIRSMKSWTRNMSTHATNGSHTAGQPEPLAVILDTFLDAIERHKEPDIGGPAEFIHVAAVIEAAKKSRASGGEWVDVE